jgi:hypothetical protein
MTPAGLFACQAIPRAPAARSTGMNAHSATLGRRVHLASWPTAARALGALATLAVGAVHLQQYAKFYSAVPTIGTLFVLNFIGATVIGIALLAPIERIAGRLAGTLLALAAIGLATTSFVFLFISERTPLFGFMEPGYDPTAIAAARISEAVTVVLLGVFLVGQRTQHRRST